MSPLWSWIVFVVLVVVLPLWGAFVMERHRRDKALRRLFAVLRSDRFGVCACGDTASLDFDGRLWCSSCALADIRGDAA